MTAVTVLGQGLVRHPAKARGQDHGTDVELAALGLLGEIDGMAAADRHTDLAGVLGQVQTSIGIDEIGRRYRLGIVDMNRTCNVQSFVILIHQVTRTIGSTQAAGCALVGVDIAGTDIDVDREVAGLALDPGEIGVAQNLDVWRPTGLNQLGRENSERAVIGGEGLVQLGHHPANGR